MKIQFTVPGKAPQLNDILRCKAAGHHAYNSLKKKWCNLVAWHASRAALGMQRRPRGMAEVSLFIVEGDRRRDPDNVAAGSRKFVHDGLVDAGVLLKDSPKYVSGKMPTEVFYTGSPGIRVTVEWEDE